MAPGLERALERLGIAAADVEGEAERRRHLDRGILEQLRRQPVDTGTLAAPGDEFRRGDHLGGGAAGEKRAISDIGDVVAAFGLVHIMG